MCGSDEGKKQRKATEARERQRQANIQAGLGHIDTAFGGFDDDFYGGRETAYLDYAMPQLQDQYEQARQQLIFTLARNNRLDSNTRAERLAELEKQFDTQRTGITDQALGIANDARSRVAQARSNLVAQNASLADPQAVFNNVQNQVGVLQQSPTFDPLGNLFQNVTGGLATSQEAARKKEQLQQLGNLYLMNDSGSGSARTVN